MPKGTIKRIIPEGPANRIIHSQRITGFKIPKEKCPRNGALY
jgi:hypothetical protein